MLSQTCLISRLCREIPGFDCFLPVSRSIHFFSRFWRRHLAEINGSLAAISFVFKHLHLLCAILFKRFSDLELKFNGHIDFPHSKSIFQCFLSNKKLLQIIFEETSHDHFCHKQLTGHSILSSVFIPWSNLYDLPVFNQISLRFYKKNAEHPGFDNFRLTGMFSTCLLKVAETDAPIIAFFESADTVHYQHVFYLIWLTFTIRVINVLLIWVDHQPKHLDTWLDKNKLVTLNKVYYPWFLIKGRKFRGRGATFPPSWA